MLHVLFCKIVLPPHGFIIKLMISGEGSFPIFFILDSQSGEITWKYSTTFLKMSFQFLAFQDGGVIPLGEL